MTDVASIRSLFLHPHPTYPIAEAASLLGMDWRDVRSLSREVPGVAAAMAWPEAG